MTKSWLCGLDCQRQNNVWWISHTHFPDYGDCTIFDAIDKDFLYKLSERLAQRIVFEHLSWRFVRVIGAPFKISFKMTEIWCNPCYRAIMAIIVEERLNFMIKVFVLFPSPCNVLQEITRAKNSKIRRNTSVLWKGV